MVTLNIAKNNSGEAREGSVTISNSETGLSSTVTISQSFDVIFSVDLKSIEVDEFGGDFEIPVHSNIPYEAYIPNKKWATVLSGQRKTVDDENFIEYVHVEPFKEKTPTRIAYVKLENEYHRQSATVTLTQYRPLFINEDPIIEIEGKQRLALELYNRDNLAVTWESSNEKVATVNEEGVVMGVGDGECFITVTSVDGKRSDYVKVVVNVPIDPTSLLKCRWYPDYEKDQSGKDSVSAVNCTFINGSDVIIYLQYAALYNDDDRISSVDYGSNPGEVINPNGSIAFSPGGSKKVDSGKGYYIEWVFLCDNKKYSLKFDQDGEYYITKSNSSTRSRSSVASRKKR